MRNGFLGSLAALAAGAGLAVAQTNSPYAALPSTAAPTAAPVVTAPTSPLPAGPAASVQPALVSPGHAPADISHGACGDTGPGCAAASCLQGCGGGCAGAPSDRLWLRADYLLWWIQHGSIPPLVTTGSPTALIPGALGLPGTRVLLGGGIDNEERSGGRFEAGYWLGDDHALGVEGGFLFLGKRTTTLPYASSGTPVLARPFFDPFRGVESAALVAFPDAQAGTVTAAWTSRLWGAEGNLRSELANGPVRLGVLGGFRWLELSEGLDLRERTAFTLPAGVLTGGSLSSLDQFNTRNQFYGGQLGAEAEWALGRLSVGVLGKVALGDNHEIVGIRGSTTSTGFTGANVTIPTGLLTLPSNSGRFSRDRFAVLPEARIDLGYRVTERLRATVGYTFLYLSDAVRPGDQIDFTVNPTQVPPPLGGGVLTGPRRPVFAFRDTDFWAQGINVGLELRY